jgi:hypothetical protein
LHLGLRWKGAHRGRIGRRHLLLLPIKLHPGLFLALQLTIALKQCLDNVLRHAGTLQIDDPVRAEVVRLGGAFDVTNDYVLADTPLMQLQHLGRAGR